MRIRIRILQLKLMRIHADPDPDPKPCPYGRFADPDPHQFGNPDPHQNENLGTDPDCIKIKKAKSCCGLKWSHGGL
jgi:hypothetical protein